MSLHQNDTFTAWEAFDETLKDFIGNAGILTDFAELIGASMKVFSAIPLQSWAVLYLVDEHNKQKNPIAMIPDGDYDEAKDFYRQLVESNMHDALCQKDIPAIDKLPSSFATLKHVLGIPLLGNTETMGVIIVCFGDQIPTLSNERADLLRLTALILTMRMENMTLKRSVLSLEKLLDQRVAARTLELQKFKTEYKTIIDCVYSGIVLIATDTRLVEYSNPAADRMLNILPNTLVGKNADVYFEDIEDDITAMNYLSLLYYDREKCVRAADGQEIPVIQAAAAVVFDKRALLLLTFFDISERKAIEQRLEKINDELEEKVNRRTEELEEIIAKLAQEIEARERSEFALEEQERMMAIIFDIINIGLCLIDSKGIILRVNNAYCALFACRKDAIVGKPLDYVLWPEQRAVTRRQFNEFMTMGETEKTQEISLINHAGDELEIRISSTIMFNNSGEKISVHALVDITELHQAQHNTLIALDKERQLNELKTNFVAMVSHEFRTPVTTILSYTQLLRNYRHRWSEEQQDRYFQNIETGVQRLTELLNEVLTLGDAEHGFLTISPESVDLQSFCREVIEEVEITMQDGMKRIRTAFFCQNSMVVIDPKIMRRILGNLLSNALKYSPETTTVLFSTLCTPTLLMFTISDEGIGIPQEHLPKIFEPFSRASNIGTISGTGLGMAIVKKAVEQIGGSIDVSSVIDKGTIVTISFPVQQSITA